MLETRRTAVSFVFGVIVVFATARLAWSFADERGSSAPAKPAAKDDSDKLFDGGEIPRLRIEITPNNLDKLRNEPRTYVRAVLVETGGEKLQGVGVKLKGAAGSFQGVDDKPAFTINSDKFAKDQSFRGLKKWHLNNSVQDETYLHELLCSELFRAAKVPATRVTHARVWLNDRDLGLYVLKEGFDRKFLKRHFPNPNGNLYDGGFVQDIDAALEKDSGDGPDDLSDLAALRAACDEKDPARRWQLLAERVDVDALLSFVAMELMTCHWDGYSLNVNNYRVYFDPTRGRAYFLPHGMDQMFGDPGATILDRPRGTVAAAVMNNTEWRTKYRERLREILPLFSPPDKLLARVNLHAGRLRPVLAAMDPELAKRHAELVNELKERLRARSANLREQVDQPDPQPLAFNDDGIAALPDWEPRSESEDAVVEQVELPGPRPTYSIQCGPSGHCVASWRRRVLLAAGRYRLEARAKTKGVAPIKDDEKGLAAGLRISGDKRTNKLRGTSDWKSLTFDFTVLEDVREVELVVELRASRGTVWFEAESLQLRRMEK